MYGQLKVEIVRKTIEALKQKDFCEEVSKKIDECLEEFLGEKSEHSATSKETSEEIERLIKEKKQLQDKDELKSGEEFVRQMVMYETNSILKEAFKKRVTDIVNKILSEEWTSRKIERFVRQLLYKNIDDSEKSEAK